jgi:hypothetical protein
MTPSRRKESIFCNRVLVVIAHQGGDSVFIANQV